MGSSDIELQWSKLSPLKSAEINSLGQQPIEGVYRISKKETDGKFYVVLIGSSLDLKQEILSLVDDGRFLAERGEFAFKYAPVKDEGVRKAIERQMYKHYAPRYNSKEPESALDVKANLS